MPVLAASDINAGEVAAAIALTLLPLVLAFVVVHAARRVVPRTVARLSDTARGTERYEQRTRTLSGTLISVIATVVWILATLTALGQVGLQLAPLLAGAGVVGLAIGFGAQQLVRDVIAGFFILVEDQYAVGDAVTTGGVTGTVESMSLRLTKLRGSDGALHHLRNGDLGVVSNASRGWALATVTVPIGADADPMAAAETLRRAMADVVASGELDAELLADPKVLGLAEVGADGAGLVEITARTTPEARSRVQRELLTAGLVALRSPRTRRAPTRSPR